jgi:hypothetical protein
MDDDSVQKSKNSQVILSIIFLDFLPAPALISAYLTEASSFSSAIFLFVTFSFFKEASKIE